MTLMLGFQQPCADRDQPHSDKDEAGLVKNHREVPAGDDDSADKHC